MKTIRSNSIKMITKDNIKKLLSVLHFEQDGDVFTKSYEGVDLPLKVDVRNEHFHYKEIGITVGRETTSNFSEPENFVVFECIDRMLSIGYKPEHIELEPAWKLGHTQKGGYADIWVRTHSGLSGEMVADKESLLIIECKKPDEFESAWRDTLEDGAQLFSYFQQEQATKFLCLYTSDFDCEKIKPVYYLINVQDNEELLKNNVGLSTYKDAKNNKQLFRVWHDTYQCDAATRGLFEPDIQPYHIGKNKFSIKDLEPIDNEEIKKKYNQFATILRRHNVGAKENAFDKLVNLFLAKVVDETNNPNDLHFYWKGAAYDDDFSLQDRLQRLYRDGMEKFLNENVTYIENEQIEKAFRWYKKDPDATMKTVMDYFRALKFYSDNDFSFISVHNERLFKENAKILREVLLMLQNIKLKSTTEEGKNTETNQFLGDLFEGFLTKGVKQSEGQYFTPMPIVRFIVSSLPLEQIISKSESIPSCIDYACGAGHFLTEYAVRIKEFVEKYRPDIDIHEYYKHITGIEKEYRLSKVSKVSAFMYGHDETNIIYADALQPHDALQPNSYDVLVANPPYSVTGFLETLSDSDRAMFSLFNKNINTAKNNAIETFFMERSAQLMRAGGVAGIVLPISVLNKGGIYAHAREIILENFDIVSLAEFGSGTFGKTGTNTVVLFLRRKETNTPAAEHYRNRVKTWFESNDNAEDIYQDEYLLQAYCDHCGYALDDYRTFLKDGTINQTLSETEVFKAYYESFDSTDRNAMKGVCDEAKDIRNRFRARSKTRSFGLQTDVQKKTEKEKALRNFIISIEREKIYIFLLAFTVDTPVLIVKSPAKTAAIKKFLGYEWSDSKGNEGIKYLHLTTSKSENDDEGDDDDTVQQIRGINGIRTPLFNPDDLCDPDKINTLIRKNFLNEDFVIPEGISEIVSQARLVEMIDFFKASFSKELKTSKVNHRPKGKFDYIRLGNILAKIEGANIKVQEDEILQSGNVPVITQEKNVLISGYVNSVNSIKTHPVVVFGDHSCTFKYVDFDFVRGADGTQLIQSSDPNIHIKYLYHFMSNSKIDHSERYERHFKYLKDMWIPLADEETQNNLIRECDAVDEEVEKAREQIDKAELEIEQAFSNATRNATKTLRLSDSRIFNLSIGRRVVSNEIVQNGQYQIVSANVHDEFGRINHSVLDDFSLPSVLWGIDGDWMVNYIEKDILFAPTDHCGVIRVFDETEIIPKYLTYPLFQAGKRERFSRANRASTERVRALTINVPDIDTQKAVVAKVFECEAQIAKAKVIINDSAKRKQAILDKYLK